MRVRWPQALLLLLALGPCAAYAQESTRVVPTVSQVVFKVLNEAQARVREGDAAAALELLDDLRRDRLLSPYELAQTWNYTAYAHLQRGETQLAVAAYATVLAQNGLPQPLRLSALKTLAQLQFNRGEHASAIAHLDDYLAAGGALDRDLHLLLGQAHYELGDYATALSHAERAIGLERKGGASPAEGTLLLLQAIHYRREDDAQLQAVLEELVERYPRPPYLRSLAGVYSQRGDTRRLLAVMEALYEQRVLDGAGDLLNLANLYLLQGVPAKAARLLEREMERGRLPTDTATSERLAQAWVQAREPRRALAPLTRAVQGGGDPGLALRLARLHIDLEQWDEAAAVLGSALARGGLERPDLAWLMLGSAEFNRGKLAAARAAFEAAAADARSRASATSWLAYLDEEGRRRTMLESVRGTTPSGT